VVRQELRGDAGEAAEALAKVVQLVPSDANAQYNLAVSHLHLADGLVSISPLLAAARTRGRHT
jgi:hypothetical protein